MKLIVTESQIKKIKEEIKGVDTKETKDKLYVIATMAYNLWKTMDDNTEVESWVRTKVDDIEMNMRAVVRGHNSDDETDSIGIASVNTDDLIIGK